MKTLLATAILLTSTATLAHEPSSPSFSSDSCNVELNGGLSINASEIEFSKNKKALYKIINNETLLVAGNEISLSANQKSLLRSYSTSIRTMVPEVKNLAIEGIDLASDGVNLAFNEFLGEGNDLGQTLTTELINIRNEIEQKFNEEHGFYVDEDGFGGDEFFGEEFEKRIEGVVETALEESIGTLLIAVGQEMLFSGGDMQAFETRMQNFGEQIEHEMENRGKGLEVKAEALCQSALKIDQLEEKLRIEIPELSDFNLIQASKDNNQI